MNLIVNADMGMGIGRDGKLLYNIPQDMKYFKKMTTGAVVIMGRKTLESLKEPLKNRVNIVLTRKKDFNYNGVIVSNSIDDVLDIVRDRENVFVIGGSEIYEQFMPYCDTAYVTRVYAESPADSYIADFGKSDEWELVSVTEKFSYGSLTYDFAVFKRKK